MAGSHIQVTTGSGPFIATGASYTEASTTVLDQKVIEGEPYLPAYHAWMISCGAAANAHVMALMAGASLNVYIRRISLFGTAAGAGELIMQVTRLTSAGNTNNGTNGLGQLDATDSAPGATILTSPTNKGTEGAIVTMLALQIQTTAGAVMEWRFDGSRTKGLKIAAGTSNGIALKAYNGGAGNSISGFIEFVEAPF